MADLHAGGGRRLRVAIVGLGPKGLFALERLLHHGRRVSAPMEIDLFEPHPAPGAGPVYDPSQPAYLRMNLAAEHLDLWPRGCRSVPEHARGSFDDWRRSAGVGDPDEPYPPRAEVGRYLADGFTLLLRHAPPSATVTLRRVAVRALERCDGGWEITSADGRASHHDEVLLTVGHGLGIDASGDGPHGAVFPVGHELSPARVPEGATVGVRGFALTCIDAALALTEGRGGTFEPDNRPHRLRYRTGPGEAVTILPFSRSGRPMLAKPDGRLTAGVPALGAIAGEGGQAILALRDGFTVAADLVEVLVSVADASLRAAGGSEADAAARAWLGTACDGGPPPTKLTAAQELERSVEVGAGLRAPDLAWALGHTWRVVYPALVERLGGRRMDDAQWPAFRRLAAQMERVAFGPPLVNAAKLLALIDAGRVDLTHVAAGDVTASGGRLALGSQPVDVVVDAVLAAPGAGTGLPSRLLADGDARTLPGRRGLDVAADAGALGRDGQRTPGLAVLGRATEDAVIGNDTLSRTLHPHADRWAQRVVHQAARVGAVPQEALA